MNIISDTILIIYELGRHVYENSIRAKEKSEIIGRQ